MAILLGDGFKAIISLTQFCNEDFQYDFPQIKLDK